GKEIIRRCHRGARDRRGQHDHALRSADLLRSNFGAVLGEGARFDVAMTVEDGAAEIAVERYTVGAEEVGGPGDAEEVGHGSCPEVAAGRGPRTQLYGWRALFARFRPQRKPV